MEYPLDPRYSAQNVDDKDINMKLWLSVISGSKLLRVGVDLPQRKVVNTPFSLCLVGVLDSCQW